MSRELMTTSDIPKYIKEILMDGLYYEEDSMVDLVNEVVYTVRIHKGDGMGDTVKLREVGNSITATIPKGFAEKSGLKAGDSVTFYLTTDGDIVLKKASSKKKTRYEQYLEEFYGKPIEEIEPVYSEELDWGYAVGEEVLDEY